MDRQTPPAPRTLAAALDTAIADGRALLDASKGTYTFDAHRWHDGSDPDEPCGVCAAGAVMARSLRVSPGEELDPGDFDGAWHWVLLGIDAMRSSDWARAFETMRMRHRTDTDEEEGEDEGLARSGARGASPDCAYAATMRWEDVEETLDHLFADAVESALDDAPDPLADAWATASEFDDADAYRRFLDLARTRVLPIVDQCERETLALARDAH